MFLGRLAKCLQDFIIRLLEINLIHCSNGSGKSTIIQSILLSFGKQHKYFPKSPEGQIILIPFSDQSKITVSANQETQDSSMNGYKCLIDDGIFNLIPAEMINEVFQELQKMKMQAIITTLNELDSIDYPKKTPVLSN